MKKIIWLFLFILITYSVQSQVKVGDNINTIDSASILELESSDKAFVITRVTATEMNLISPLHGAMVYNIDDQCIYVFQGSIWKSLCNSQITVISTPTPPTLANEGDVWVNDTNGQVHIWDGTTWIPVTRNPSSDVGPPTNATNPNPIIGDIYVDQTTGDLYTYNGSTWINQTVNATNGITETTNNTFELGGTLITPTSINTDNINTLALSGLQVEMNNTDIVTVEPSTGILRKTPVSAFLQQEEIVIVANDAQTQFTPPLPVTSSKKLNVYRNGVKLGFTIIDSSTIELETPVICYQNDEIRIVQFY